MFRIGKKCEVISCLLNRQLILRNVYFMIRLKELFSFKHPLITAASGLVHSNNTLYVVSDDERGIISLKLDLTEKAVLHSFGGKRLSEDPAKRKKEKPDYECIALFSNSLLLIPSGSTPTRDQAALVNLDDFKIESLSFKNSYQYLSKHIPELNIEGAVISGDHIILLQRGNGAKKFNAIIELKLEDLLNDHLNQIKITPVDLGSHNNINLGFTDATIHNGHIYFLSVGEASGSTYHDGQFEGAFLGIMGFDGMIQKLDPLQIYFKPEGLTIIDDFLYIVTDSDNRTIESKLYISVDKI